MNISYKEVLQTRVIEVLFVNNYYADVERMKDNMFKQQQARLRAKRR